MDNTVSATMEDTTCISNLGSGAEPHLLYVAIVACIFALPTIIWLVSYLVPQIYMILRPVPNLKEKYNCEWALVTGAATGIGRAIAFKLASQGLNVILCSLDDDDLDDTMYDIQEEYPEQQFRAISDEFSPNVQYLRRIEKATKDLDVRIIFNNAGFIATGFLDQTPLDKLLSNIECNAVASLKISHLFVQRMVENKQTGCIVFTSSVSAFIPNPFAAMYGATKSFLSQMAASIHVEVSNLGIDVCAVHPSPVASKFYENVDHKIDLMESAAKNAAKPDALPDAIFKSIGACALRDIGGMALMVRMGTAMLPPNMFTRLFATFAPYLKDYKVHNLQRSA